MDPLCRHEGGGYAYRQRDPAWALDTHVEELPHGPDGCASDPVVDHFDCGPVPRLGTLAGAVGGLVVPVHLADPRHRPAIGPVPGDPFSPGGCGPILPISGTRPLCGGLRSDRYGRLEA